MRSMDRIYYKTLTECNVHSLHLIEVDSGERLLVVGSVDGTVCVLLQYTNTAQCDTLFHNSLLYPINQRSPIEPRDHAEMVCSALLLLPPTSSNQSTTRELLMCCAYVCYDDTCAAVKQSWIHINRAVYDTNTHVLHPFTTVGINPLSAAATYVRWLSKDDHDNSIRLLVCDSASVASVYSPIDPKDLEKSTWTQADTKSATDADQDVCSLLCEHMNQSEHCSKVLCVDYCSECVVLGTDDGRAELMHRQNAHGIRLQWSSVRSDSPMACVQLSELALSTDKGCPLSPVLLTVPCLGRAVLWKVPLTIANISQPAPLLPLIHFEQSVEADVNTCAHFFTSGLGDAQRHYVAVGRFDRVVTIYSLRVCASENGRSSKWHSTIVRSVCMDGAVLGVRLMHSNSSNQCLQLVVLCVLAVHVLQFNVHDID